MDTKIIFRELDKKIEMTEDVLLDSLPKELVNNLQKWKWGAYGWSSPVSLLITATWKKKYDNDSDCCKIWADDESGNAIKGAYSIRTLDETITIPLFAKYDLCKDFCSPNSGMQGSRAIEKMRSERRLNKNFASKQRTVFDLSLFATIMNQINELSVAQCDELLSYFIVKTKAIQKERKKQELALVSASSHDIDVLSLLKKIRDPELTKCVVAACIKAVFSHTGGVISGVDDYKTAADERAEKPGDLCVSLKGSPLVAVEVKDKSQHIDWKNIERAKTIIGRFPSLKTFMFVLENRAAANNEMVQQMENSEQLNTGKGSRIVIVSVHDLYVVTSAFIGDDELLRNINVFMSMAPAIKASSRTEWLNGLKNG